MKFKQILLCCVVSCMVAGIASAQNTNNDVILLKQQLQQLQDNLRALQVKLTAQEVKELDEVSAPAWGYPYNFIGTREPW